MEILATFVLALFLIVASIIFIILKSTGKIDFNFKLTPKSLEVGLKKDSDLNR